MFSTREGFGHFGKHYNKLERPVSDKHSILFDPFDGYKEKKFEHGPIIQ
jgi:hypothetical protein